MKISEKYTKYKNIIPFGIIFFTVIISALLFSSHSMQILSDRGRELLIPMSILNGETPYKDILMIYFPLAYYINSMLFKIFGSSLNSVYFLQTIFCIIFSGLFFIISNKFFSRNFSLILTLLITEACLFSPTVFGYILPYSYSVTYGLMFSLGFLLCLIKLFESKKNNYAYFASFFAGLAVCCKAEFLPLIIVLITGLYLYRKENFTFYLKNIFSFMTMPLILLTVLFISGVNLQILISAISFSADFSGTPSMRYFLEDTGMIPHFNINFIKTAVISLWGVFWLTITSLAFSKIKNKIKNKAVVLIFGILLCVLLFVFTEPYYYTFFLPILLFLLFMLNVKKFTNNPMESVLILTALVLSPKVFWGMKMNLYGTYFFPLLIVAISILLNNYFEKTKNTDIKISFNFIIIFYLIFFTTMNFICREYTKFPLTTAKGTVYIPESQGKLLSELITYINRNTKINDKILVVPEGAVINYLSDRPCNMNLHILDRLHYDALGEEKSKEILKKQNNDYIIIVKGFNLSTFGNTDFYNEKNELTGYLSSEYYAVKIYKDNGKENEIIILKRK